jgi:hypothetical protein
MANYFHALLHTDVHRHNMYNTSSTKENQWIFNIFMLGRIQGYRKT